MALYEAHYKNEIEKLEMQAIYLRIAFHGDNNIFRELINKKEEDLTKYNIRTPKEIRKALSKKDKKNG